METTQHKRSQRRWALSAERLKPYKRSKTKFEDSSTVREKRELLIKSSRQDSERSTDSAQRERWRKSEKQTNSEV
jgi:hypothetical protein